MEFTVDNDLSLDMHDICMIYIVVIYNHGIIWWNTPLHEYIDL